MWYPGTNNRNNITGYGSELVERGTGVPEGASSNPARVKCFSLDGNS